MISEKLDAEALVRLVLTIIFVFFGFHSPDSYGGSCGAFPMQPTLLKQPKLTSEQFDNLTEKIDEYFHAVSTYKRCLQAATPSFDPEGTEAAKYLSIAEEQARLYEAVEEQKIMVIDRYNFHVQSERKEALNITNSKYKRFI